MTHALSGHFSSSTVDLYGEIAQRVRQVLEVLAERSIRVRSGSSLSQLLRQAEILDREWTEGKNGSISVLCDAAHANRLAIAVLELRHDPAIQEPLRRMASNVMMPECRRQSQGKDALWEILLLAQMRKAGVASRFEDPPDIVTTMNGHDYPIACKKIWSENGVEGQVRKAIRQLSRFGNGGVIALNLDDLVPSGHLLPHDDQNSAGDALHALNYAFYMRHQRVLQAALEDGDLPGFSIPTPSGKWH